MKKQIIIPLLLLLFGINACKKEEGKAGISVCVTGIREYRSDSISWEVYPVHNEWQDESFTAFGVSQALFKQIDAGGFNAEIYDWDLSIMNSVNVKKNRHEWLDSYTYFLVFEEESSTDSNQCCIKLALHRGRPYNKISNSIADFHNCARIGDYDSLSKTPIYDKARACKVAANKAANMAVLSGLMK